MRASSTIELNCYQCNHPIVTDWKGEGHEYLCPKCEMRYRVDWRAKHDAQETAYPARQGARRQPTAGKGVVRRQRQP